MNSNPARFGLGLPTSNCFIFHARFKDGTGLDTVVPADTAIINTFSEGSTGFWSGTRSGWAGSPDVSSFKVYIDFRCSWGKYQRNCRCDIGKSLGCMNLWLLTCMLETRSQKRTSTGSGYKCRPHECWRNRMGNISSGWGFHGTRPGRRQDCFLYKWWWLS